MKKDLSHVILSADPVGELFALTPRRSATRSEVVTGFARPGAAQTQSPPPPQAKGRRR